MCGILGHFSFGDGRPDVDLWRALVNLVGHRGPDDSTFWHDGPFVFGHRRLSIIDLVARAAADGDRGRPAGRDVQRRDLQLHRAARRADRAAATGSGRGPTPKCCCTGTAQWGTGLPARLRGMFAFALADRGRRELFVARDRFGEKPLFYAQRSRRRGVRVGAESARRAPGTAARNRRRVARRLSVPELRAGHGDDAARACTALRRRPGSLWSARWRRAGRRLLVAAGSAASPICTFSMARGDRAAGGAARFVGAARPAQRRAGRHVSVRRHRFVARCAERGAVRPVVGGLLPDVRRSQLQRVAESRSDRAAARRSAASRSGSDPSALDDFLRLVEHADDPLADSSAVAVWTLAREVARDVKVVLERRRRRRAVRRLPDLSRDARRTPRSRRGCRRRSAAMLARPAAAADQRAKGLRDVTSCAGSSARCDLPAGGRTFHLERHVAAGRGAPARRRRRRLADADGHRADAARRRVTASTGAADAAAAADRRRPRVPAERHPRQVRSDEHGARPRGAIAVSRSRPRRRSRCGCRASLKLSRGRRTTKRVLRELAAPHLRRGRRRRAESRASASRCTRGCADRRGRSSRTCWRRASLADIPALDAQARSAAVVADHMSGRRSYGFELWGLMVLVAWHRRYVREPVTAFRAGPVARDRLRWRPAPHERADRTSTTHRKELTHDRLTDRFDELMDDYDLGRRTEVLVDQFLGEPTPRQAGARRRLRRRRRDARARRAGARASSRSTSGRSLAAETRARCGCDGGRRHAGGDRLRVRTASMSCSRAKPSSTRPTRGSRCSELYRLVKPGGDLVLSMPNRLWQAPVRAASAIGLRPYDGYENFLWPRQLRRVLERAGAEIVEHRGIHLWPFQITPLRGLSRWVDRFGRRPAAADDQSVPALPETVVQFTGFSAQHINKLGKRALKSPASPVRTGRTSPSCCSKKGTKWSA